jgi:thiamine-phosphate pyrophosphorylase
MNPPAQFPHGLYGITPEWHDTGKLLLAIEHAAQGGMAALQWRRKTLDASARLPEARRIADLCKRLGVCFIVNDDWRFAAAIDADGVHIGRDDGQVSDARMAIGPDKILGCSCYDSTRLAEQALAAGADYVAFGAVYPSTVKPNAPRVTLDTIKAGHALAARGARPATVVAIGGITPDNAGPVIAAGADSIAMISGLFEAPDIRAAAAACRALFQGVR